MELDTSTDDVEIRTCRREDIARLEGAGLAWQDLAHHRKRWALQQRGAAIYLLAWRDGVVVGRVTLLFRSRYESVRSAYSALWELNALEARPTGQGVGTLLISRARAAAAGHGVGRTGLAVESGNTDARRLYSRLGYCDWGHGTVVDEWTEFDEAGTPVREHHDTCHYLIRSTTERAVDGS